MKTLTVTTAGLMIVSANLSAAKWPDTTPLVYRGVCDASATAPLDSGLFVVAGDEDNVLRVYAAARPGLPVYAKDLSSFLQVDPESPEVDLEGAARTGNTIFWISSHGRNASGKERLSRQRLFATRIVRFGESIELQPVERPYTRLLEDMFRDPQLVRYRLHIAAQRPPKSAGALNIEGLAFTPGGHLLIGFRNPIPDGKALLVPMLNPVEAILGYQAEFGPPMLLDLGGLGIRSIEPMDNNYLIMAGSFDGSGRSRLYLWDGGSDRASQLVEAPPGFNPEAITRIQQGNDAHLLVLSDDGTEKVQGKDCKKIKDPDRKVFRCVLWSVTQLPFETAFHNTRTR